MGDSVLPLLYHSNVAKRSGAETLVVDVCDQLRSEIFSCVLAPGERLLPAELGSRFGVSVSVMREALGLLSAQSLVRVERNRGCHVTPLSPASLRELTFARQVNEGAALRMSVEQGDVLWESEVLAAGHRLASEPHYDSNNRRSRAWAIAHTAFHRALIAACGNELLLGICNRLSDSAELYRAWSGELPDSHHRDIAEEHRSLMEAAVEHDFRRSVELFEAHVQRTTQLLLDSGSLIEPNISTQRSPTASPHAGAEASAFN